MMPIAFGPIPMKPKLRNFTNGMLTEVELRVAEFRHDITFRGHVEMDSDWWCEPDEEITVLVMSPHGILTPPPLDGDRWVRGRVTELLTFASYPGQARVRISIEGTPMPKPKNVVADIALVWDKCTFSSDPIETAFEMHWERGQ